LPGLCQVLGMELQVGTRGKRHNHKFIRLITAMHTFLYRATGGFIGGLIAGAPQLLLTHTGRKSGKRFTSPLLCLPDGANLVVVASYGGQAQAPQWAYNLLAQLPAEVQLGSHRWPVSAELADEATHARMWPVFCRYYPGYLDYQARTDRQIPLLVLRPIVSEKT
jgi:deazaflavin-dependent oxidoreductase (nitroreductase family)